MRTTVDVEPELLRQVKQRAAERQTTLSAVINEALREVFYRRAAAQRTGPTMLTVDHRRGGLRPGVDLDNNAALLEIMDSRDPV
jgi:hypothetical protein